MDWRRLVEVLALRQARAQNTVGQKYIGALTPGESTALIVGIEAKQKSEACGSFSGGICVCPKLANFKTNSI